MTKDGKTAGDRTGGPPSSRGGPTDGELRALARSCEEGDEAAFVTAYEPHVDDDATYRRLLASVDADADLRSKVRRWARGFGAASFVVDPATMRPEGQAALFAIPFEPRPDGATPDPADVTALIARASPFGTGSRATVFPSATGAPWLSGATPARLRAVLNHGLVRIDLEGPMGESEADETRAAAAAALARLTTPTTSRAPKPGGDRFGMLRPTAVLGARLLPLDGRRPCQGPTDMLWSAPDAHHVVEARVRFAAEAAADPALSRFGLGPPLRITAAVPTLTARAALRALAGRGPRATVHALLTRRGVTIGSAAADGAGGPGPVTMPTELVREDEDAFVDALGPAVEVHGGLGAFMAAIGREAGARH